MPLRDPQASRTPLLHQLIRLRPRLRVQEQRGMRPRGPSLREYMHLAPRSDIQLLNVSNNAWSLTGMAYTRIVYLNANFVGSRRFNFDSLNSKVFAGLPRHRSLFRVSIVMSGSLTGKACPPYKRWSLGSDDKLCRILICRWVAYLA